MLLKFELKMPNNNSWNGKWSGENCRYLIFENLPKKEAEKIVGKSFYYNFGDGWGASVKCEKANKREKSNGFCGYDWMVYEIIKYGKIFNLSQRDFKEKLENEIKIFIKDFAHRNKIINTDKNFLFENIESIIHSELI